MRDLQLENGNEVQIKLVRKYLKLKIIEDNVTFRGHNHEREHIYELMKKTIVNGESHSAMILGPRGSGKTTVINSVIHQLHNEVDIKNDALIIKLNGVVHNDDKIALKSITAQMQLENAVGNRVFGSFAENLSFLLSCLQSGADRRCKSMVFILEQCDMFCHSASGKTQALLYNLFDLTHSQQAPLCVLGITNRIDVMELLEKRVKSRFSHRHIYIFPNEETVNGENMVNPPLDNYLQLFIELLSIPVKKSNKKKSRKKSDTLMDIDNCAQYAIPDAVLERCNIDKEEFNKLQPDFISDWNSHIKDLAGNEKVVDSIEKFCYYTVNEQIFRNVLFQIVSTLSPKKCNIDASTISATIDKTVASEHRVKQLQSLSILELSLVIAMKHGQDVFDGQPMNFEMVLHRYTKFANTNSTTQSVPRPVILKAFEHLQALEIITPIKSLDSIYSVGETTASRVQKEYQLYTLAVPMEDLQEAVKGFRALPTEIGHWFNNSVV